MQLAHGEHYVARVSLLPLQLMQNRLVSTEVVVV